MTAPNPSSPLFIIGTERSGSNLLRLILDAHPRLFVPHPPHILRYFSPLEPRYGDLAQDDAFRRLVDDVLRLVDGHIHRWDRIPPAPEVIALAPSRDLFGVFAGVYESARQASGKPRWGCKSTFVVDHGARVIQTFPGARFLWLVRDPRDVVVSSASSVFSPFHPYFTARLWAEQQATALALEAAHPQAVLRVPYEALVSAPEAQVQAVCDFLGETPDPAMLAWYTRDEARRSASLSESWANTGKPIQRGSVGRWQQALRPDEVALVETLAGPAMQALGYAGSGLPPVKVGPLDRARYRLADRAGWLQVEARSLRRDRNVWQRWGREVLMRRIALELRLHPPGPG